MTIRTAGSSSQKKTSEPVILIFLLLINRPVRFVLNLTLTGRRVVRSGLLDALLVSNNLTRPQILQSLRTIASNDFPHKMPGFLEQLSQNLDPALQHPDRAMASVGLMSHAKSFVI